MTNQIELGNNKEPLKIYEAQCMVLHSIECIIISYVKMKHDRDEVVDKMKICYEEVYLMMSEYIIHYGWEVGNMKGCWWIRNNIPFLIILISDGKMSTSEFHELMDVILVSMSYIPCSLSEFDMHSIMVHFVTHGPKYIFRTFMSERRLKSRSKIVKGYNDMDMCGKRYRKCKWNIFIKDISLQLHDNANAHAEHSCTAIQVLLAKGLHPEIVDLIMEWVNECDCTHSCIDKHHIGCGKFVSTHGLKRLGDFDHFVQYHKKERHHIDYMIPSRYDCHTKRSGV